jgi:hypothetical protein
MTEERMKVISEVIFTLLAFGWLAVIGWGMLT